MNYLNITTARVKQELSSFKDKIKDDAKHKAKQTSQFLANVICLTFFISLVISGYSTIIFADPNSNALTHTISAYVAVISFIAFVSSMVFAIFLGYIDESEFYLKKVHEKVCKEYCEQYRVDNLEDDNSLQKILISIFSNEFLEEKMDTEIYQYLYEHRMLRPEELDKIDKFLASNNVNFRDYVLALDSELLAHIVDPYRAEMKREIEEAVASFFLEKDRTKQEEERAKSLERQKQNLFIEKTNGFASSMLGKNLAI